MGGRGIANAERHHFRFKESCGGIFYVNCILRISGHRIHGRKFLLTVTAIEGAVHTRQKINVQLGHLVKSPVIYREAERSVLLVFLTTEEDKILAEGVNIPASRVLGTSSFIVRVPLATHDVTIFAKEDRSQ